MKIRNPNKNQFAKRAKKGFRGFPVGTIAFYGPTASHATKVAVGIMLRDGGEPAFLERWRADDDEDVRYDEDIGRKVTAFLREHAVLTVSSVDRIIGCPHEEGIDYPDGESCPECPFWRSKDRFTHETIH
jgi:hypothetical protein